MTLVLSSGCTQSDHADVPEASLWVIEANGEGTNAQFGALMGYSIESQDGKEGELGDQDPAWPQIAHLALSGGSKLWVGFNSLGPPTFVDITIYRFEDLSPRGVPTERPIDVLRCNIVAEADRGCQIRRPRSEAWGVGGAIFDAPRTEGRLAMSVNAQWFDPDQPQSDYVDGAWLFAVTMAEDQ